MTCPSRRRRSGTASDAKAGARADLFGASLASALQKPGCPVCVNLAEGGRQHVHGAAPMEFPANDSAVAQCRAHSPGAVAAAAPTEPVF